MTWYAVCIIVLLAIALLLLGAAVFLYRSTTLRGNSILNKNTSAATALPDYLVQANKLHEQAMREIERMPKEPLSRLSPDGLRLCATYIPAEAKSERTVVLSHGYTSTGYRDFARYIPFYHSQGFNVLLVDHRAHGESEGKYIDYGYYSSKDLKAWCVFIIEKFGCGQSLFLHGISMGTATALMATAYGISNLKAVVADCGYSTLSDELKFVLNNKMRLPAFPIIPFCSLINRLLNGFFFKAVCPIDAVKKLELPCLFIHGKKDKLIPYSMTERMYNECPSHSKRLLLVENARHASSFMFDEPNVKSAILETFAKGEQI